MADRKHGGGLEGAGKEGQGPPQKCVVMRFEAPGPREPQGPCRCVEAGAFETWRCVLRPWGSQVFKGHPGHPEERVKAYSNDFENLKTCRHFDLGLRLSR